MTREFRTVRARDIFPVSRFRGPVVVQIPSFWGPQTLPPELPTNPRERDRILYRTVLYESQWASAVSIAITKFASAGWEVESHNPRLSQRAQELLLYADFGASLGGWTNFIAKQLRSFLCTNLGSVFEVEREKSGSAASRVVGIHHLPSLRCTPTGDPDFPIIYTDQQGRDHLLAWYEVVRIIDMPEDDDLVTGLGLCAAERAYSSIIRLAALERYVYEKVSGSRPLSIYLVNGLRTDQLSSLLRSAEEQQREQGLTSYMGAIIGGTLKPDAPPGVVEIPLSSLPDGFDPQAERERADLVYANAIGLDPQDLRPISNQQMGAGAQSAVLHEKAKGRGLVYFRQAFTHAMNALVLDRRVKFLFTERDLDDQLKRADLSSRRIKNIETMVSAQLITPDQGRQLLLDLDELPPEFVPVDQTSTTSVSDADQPRVDLPTDTGEGELPPVTLQEETRVDPLEVVDRNGQADEQQEAWEESLETFLRTLEELDEVTIGSPSTSD